MFTFSHSSHDANVSIDRSACSVVTSIDAPVVGFVTVIVIVILTLVIASDHSLADVIIIGVLIG